MRYSVYAGSIGQRPYALDAKHDRDALEAAIKLDADVHVVIRWEPMKRGATIFEDWRRPLCLEHPVFSQLIFVSKEDPHGSKTGRAAAETSTRLARG